MKYNRMIYFTILSNIFSSELASIEPMLSIAVNTLITGADTLAVTHLPVASAALANAGTNVGLGTLSAVGGTIKSGAVVVATGAVKVGTATSNSLCCRWSLRSRCRV